MNFSEIELPSNRKFGFFFSGVFVTTGAYFYLESNVVISYLFTALGLLFLMVTLVKADVLLPLNALWMRFGLLLAMVVSPIVLGVIFFGLFAPVGILMRVFGRDELSLKLNQKNSHWVHRNALSGQTSTFKNQF